MVLIFDFAFSSSANHNLLDSIFTLEDMLIILLLLLSSIPLEKQFLALTNPSQWPVMIVLYRMISYFSHQSPQNHYRESSKLTRLLTEWMIIINNHLSFNNGEITFINGIHGQIIKEDNTSSATPSDSSSSASSYEGSIMKIICQELLKKGYLTPSSPAAIASSSASSVTSTFLSFFSNCFLATLHQFHFILLSHLIQNVLSSPSIPSSISDNLLQRQQVGVSSSKPMNSLDQEDLLETSNDLLSSSASSDHKLSKLKNLLSSALSSSLSSPASSSSLLDNSSSSLFSWNLYSNNHHSCSSSLSLFQRFHYFSCFSSIDDLYSFLKEYQRKQQQEDDNSNKEEGNQVIVTKELLETLWKNDLTLLFEIIMFLLDDCYYLMKTSSP
jgi:hypothetical protein